MYSKNQIKNALENKFIQVKVTTNKGLDFINSIVKDYNQKPFRDNGQMYFFGQSFEADDFGLNGSFSKIKELTVILDKDIKL